MNKAILKYPLEVEDTQIVTLPARANILCVQAQHGQPMMWAIVDRDEKRLEQIILRIIGTGNPAPDDPGEYIGTFQLNAGNFIGHAFKVR